MIGTSEENRTLISRLSGATGYKSAVLPLNYRGVAESIRFELMRRFLNDSLANCWFNHSPNSPLFGGSGEIRTHGPFLIVCFQDRCNKPDSATLPLITIRMTTKLPHHNIEDIMHNLSAPVLVRLCLSVPSR